MNHGCAVLCIEFLFVALLECVVSCIAKRSFMYQNWVFKISAGSFCFSFLWFGINNADDLAQQSMIYDILIIRVDKGRKWFRCSQTVGTNSFAQCNVHNNCFAFLSGSIEGFCRILQPFRSFPVNGHIKVRKISQKFGVDFVGSGTAVWCCRYFESLSSDLWIFAIRAASGLWNLRILRYFDFYGNTKV